MDDLVVSPAREEDLEAAAAILCEAARWIAGRGEPLWDPADLTPQKLRPDVTAGRLHLGRLAGEPVGTISLQWRDRLFWPDAADDDSAFFHRLAVRRRVAGSGVAAGLVAWAEGRAREAGRRWLRLDCSARHAGLCRWYERQGFERHSQDRLGEWHFVRYQKRLEVDSPG